MRRLAAFALSGGLLVAALSGSGDEVTLTAVGDDEAAGARSSGDGGPGAGGATVTTTARPTTTTAPPTTTTTAPPTTLPPTTTTTLPDPAADGLLELGEGGPSVLALQQRLGELGYWLGDADGNYGQLTRQAVMAFQKAEGLPRDGAAGPVTRDRLAVAGRQAPRDGTGHHIEIDLARQIILVVDGGQVRYVLNTSTGSGEAYGSSSGGTAVATTPTGHFAIDRQIDGVRQAPLGTLYRPKYFNGGIAVHGAGNIPAYPASHGCARVTNAAIDMLWGSGLAEIGTPVSVY
ncbi:MAG TPA: L,D-transpeptidase family protein [Acidimicrobiales bacterium]